MSYAVGCVPASAKPSAMLHHRSRSARSCSISLCRWSMTVRASAHPHGRTTQQGRVATSSATENSKVDERASNDPSYYSNNVSHDEPPCIPGTRLDALSTAIPRTLCILDRLRGQSHAGWPQRQSPHVVVQSHQQRLHISELHSHPTRVLLDLTKTPALHAVESRCRQPRRNPKVDESAANDPNNYSNSVSHRSAPVGQASCRSNRRR